MHRRRLTPCLPVTPHLQARIEACTAWLDSVTYQMQHRPQAEQAKLAGPIALLKYFSTRMVLMVGDHASQIFGGRAVTRTGMGAQVRSAPAPQNLE